jgi:hypothetical protein
MILKQITKAEFQFDNFQECENTQDSYKRMGWTILDCGETRDYYFFVARRED